MKMKVTSAYEILEIRLGRGVRTLATIFFLSLRFLWMATIIYATVDVALIPVFGLDPGWVPIISVVLAVITVIYTTMGGLKAVVLTDVIQTVVMFAGVLLTIGIIGGKVGSVGAFFEPQLFEHWPPIEWGSILETNDGRQYFVDDFGLAGLYGWIGSDGYSTLSLYSRCGYGKTVVSDFVGHLLHHSTAVGGSGVGGDDLFPALSANAGSWDYGCR